MQYRPCPVTERILQVKEDYLKMPVPMENDPYVDKKYRHFCTGDRWITLGFLEGWLANERAETARRRRSYAEANELYAAKPQIGAHELLLGHPYLPEYTPEEQARYDDLCEKFRMSNITLQEYGPRIDHLSLDIAKLLHLGVNGLIAEVEAQESALNLNDPAVYPDFEVIRKYDFYECCLLELRALLDLASRYAKAAKEAALCAEEPRRSELIRMGEIMERVPAEPARNFREAIQSANFFLGTLFGLYPQNRPDRDFWEFYRRDLESGSITQAEAQELIDNYCLNVSTRVFSRAACGFIVGGQDVRGNLVENDLTYMFLTALDHIRMPDPNGALAINSQTSEDILKYSVEILSHGVTHPAFYNDNAIIDSLIKYGCTREDAVNYIHTTCAEISVVGKSRSHTTCTTIALPVMLKEAVRDAKDNITFEELCKSVIANMRARLVQENFLYVQRMLDASRNGNEPMRVCCLVADCVSRGRSITEGGERYSFLQPILVGFATCVDSLAAIRALVYEQKKLSLRDFLDIVDGDYADNEAFRQTLIHRLPHYGNDDESVDALAKWLAKQIEDVFAAKDMLAGNILMPGTFSYNNHATMGAVDGASFDGRRAHVSYSDGCGPVQGRDTNGPTAMVLSMTSWDQSAFLAGMVINVKFSPEHLSDEKSGVFLAMLKTFIERGGLEMQVNAVCRATLEDAKLHPENHADLIVRIGGFSDYFVRLTPELQDEIIERTEY